MASELGPRSWAITRPPLGPPLRPLSEMERRHSRAAYETLAGEPPVAVAAQ